MLSESDLAELEATLLPALERHHLRLLAHGLRTLQAISASQGSSAQDRQIPGRASLERWALEQEAVAGDQAFAAALAQQLLGAHGQLEAIGQPIGKAPLDLELADLIAWATASVGHLNILSVTFTVTLIGVGIDYGIYLLSRIEEEYRVHAGDLTAAITATLTTTGKAIHKPIRNSSAPHTQG